jgi:hypothetical protein
MWFIPFGGWFIPLQCGLFPLIDKLFPFTQFTPTKKAASLAAAPSIL